MILIGNGTGIAGLRGHLKARASRGRHRNWLIFGERTSKYDSLFSNDISAWRDSGHIQRVDLAFSQDQDAKIYVHHIILQAAQDIRQWIDQGAMIFVCGSRNGMSEDVDVALGEVLGDRKLDELLQAGRYRRDVY